MTDSTKSSKSYKKSDANDDATDDTQKEGKLPSWMLATMISVGAVVAAILAFFITTKVMSGGFSSQSPCDVAKEEILAVKALAPDAAVLDTNPTLSLRLKAAGEKLYSNCIYKDGREFEMANIDNWLGTAPAPTTGSTVPADTAPASSAPTDSTVPAATEPASGE
jgi:hypothetical protein